MRMFSSKNAIIYKLGIGLRSSIPYILIPLFLAMGATDIAERLSPRINSQSQLEERLIIDRKRMKIPNNVVIRGFYFKKDDERASALGSNCRGCSMKVSDKHYKFALVERKQLPSKFILQHELYHIADGHLDNSGSKFKDSLMYYLWYEPKAKIYGLIYSLRND